MFYRTLVRDKMQVQPCVNPIQELVRVSHQMFQDFCVIPWDPTLFGVDNGGIPLYITIHDVFEIVQGNQLLNITVISTMDDVNTLNNYMLFNQMMFHESCH